MSQELSLENRKGGLESDYEKRRVNSFELGKGIHFNTIRNHEKLYAYYKEKSKSYKKRQKEIGKHLPYWENKKHAFHEFGQLKPDRNLKHVYKQYMSLTKAELATRLIEAEQYIAEGNLDYLKKLFKTYEG
ncbi:TPA: hypothetical protein QCU53_005991 [Bacillus thuringiensis]|nr:hypothetical protein [Bacillus thuringiensis]